MAMKVNKSKASSKKWGDVDKSALGKRLSEAYASGEASKAVIREVYAFVPEDAFGKDDDGNPTFAYSKAWGPHHEVSGDEVILNRDGLGAAAAALGGARSEPGLSAEEQKKARTHLRRHYRAIDEDEPDSLKESLRRVERGRALEELVKGSLDYTMHAIRSAFEKQFKTPEGLDYWIAEIFSEHVIVSEWRYNGQTKLKPDEYWLVTYTKDGDSYTFAALDDWEIVELAYQAQTMDEAKQPQAKKNGRRRRFEERMEAARVTLEEDEQEGGPRRIRVEGAMTVGVVNDNGRRYPRPVVVEALNELRQHLHESAGQGRALQMLGEAEHPSGKPSRRPNLLETVVKWNEVTLNGDRVDLEGHVIETSKGRDILALIDGGVETGVSMRGYGDSDFVKEGGRTVEEVKELHFTGFDLVLEPAFVNTVFAESREQEDEEMDPEKLKELIEAHPELFEGMLTKKMEEMKADDLKALEERARKALGLDDKEELGPALEEAAAARKELAERKRKDAVEAAITEATKELPYGKDLNAAFVEELRDAAAEIAPDKVKALAENLRKRYDWLVSKAKLAGLGWRGDGVQVLGPVLESETGVPEFAKASFQFTEALVRAGEARHRDYRKADLSRNEMFAKLYLERFDKVYAGYLKQESRLLEEAETTVDLNLPYSVSRAVVAEAIPELIATSVFDVGVTDQSPVRIYFETFAGETGYTATVTDEAVTADLGVWVSLANKRVTPGTVVVTSSPAGTTYVEGTDYVIDYELGRLMALSGGDISDDQALLVDYQYTAIRKGEMAPIERGEMQLTFQLLDCQADRLAQQISSEAVVFGRSQIGWDATARTLVSLINQIRRKIDQGLLYKALAAALRVSNNSGGTWDSSLATDAGYEAMVRALGAARVKVSGPGRYYRPSGIVASETVSDLAANWKGFTQAGSRPDASLRENGYIGSLKGLPWFKSTEFSDGYILVVDRGVVIHRVHTPMRLDGPHKSRDASTGKLIAAEEWFAEEYNGSLAPVPEKAAYVVVT